MTKYFFILCSLFSISNLWAADGIDFFHGTLKEAQELAAKEHKLIFMDAYTSWCGPCKRMAKEVFSTEEAGAFFNEHFINLKVDMEKGEGPKLASKYRVNSYPTLLFLNEKGEVVHAAKGGRGVAQFIDLGKAALSKNDRSQEYAKEYEKGKRDPEFLRAYAYALLKSSKPALKIANEYVRTQDKLDSKENLEFLFDFALESDSKIFELATQHQKQLIALKSKERFLAKMQHACDATVKKALEFKVPSLVNEAKQNMKLVDAKSAKSYALLADMQYALGTGDYKTYVSQGDKYLKKYAKKDADAWHQYAQVLIRTKADEKALKKAEEWVKQALSLNHKAEYLQTHSEILFKLGLHDAAKEALEKAAELSGKTPKTAVKQGH